MSNDYNIKVLNKETTLQILLEDHNSSWFAKRAPVRRQQSPFISRISDVFEKLDRYNDYCRNFYQNSFFPNNHDLLREVELQYNVYVSTFFSRPYIDLVDKSHAKDYFAKMKQLWQDRDLLIVEGKYSRSGEGMTCFLMLDQLVDSFVRQLMHIVAKKLLKMKLLKMQLIG